MHTLHWALRAFAAAALSFLACFMAALLLQSVSGLEMPADAYVWIPALAGAVSFIAAGRDSATFAHVICGAFGLMALVFILNDLGTAFVANDFAFLYFVAVIWGCAAANVWFMRRFFPVPQHGFLPE